MTGINFNLMIIGFCVGAGAATIASSLLERDERSKNACGLLLILIGVLWSVATI